MKTLKISRLLALLTAIELKAFRKYLMGQLRSSKSPQLALFVFLRKFYPDFEHDRLTKTTAFQYVYPNEEYDDKKLRTISSKVSKLIEEFLVLNELKTQPYLKHQLLAKVYSDRNHYFAFEQTTTNLISQLEAKPERDMNFYKEMQTLNHDLFFHPDTPKHQFHPDSIYEAINNLDRYFILSKLRYSCEIMMRKKSFGEEMPNLFAQEIKVAAQRELGQINPLFGIYLQILEFHESGKYDEKEMDGLRLEFEQNMYLAGLQEQSMILNHLLNLAIAKAYAGHFEFNTELWKLYKLGLDEKLILSNNRITEASFTNIANVGAALGKYEWTYTFIETYKTHLADRGSRNAEILSKATLYYHQLNNKPALLEELTDLLMQVDHSNHFYHIRAQLLLIRTYYEHKIEDILFLESQIKTLSLFVKRKSGLGEEKKKPILNFLKMIRTLSGLKNRWQSVHEIPAKDRLENLLLSLQENQAIILKHWLRNEIEQLLSSR